MGRKRVKKRLALSYFEPRQIRQALSQIDATVADEVWPQTATGRFKKTGKFSEFRMKETMAAGGTPSPLCAAVLDDLIRSKVVRVGKSMLQIRLFVNFAGEQDDSSFPDRELHLNRARWREYAAETFRRYRWRPLGRNGSSRQRGDSLTPQNGTDHDASEKIIQETISTLRPIERKVLLELHSRQQPSWLTGKGPGQEQIAQLIGCKWNANLNSILSGLVRGKLLGNGRQKNYRGGYFLTEYGLDVCRRLQSATRHD